MPFQWFLVDPRSPCFVPSQKLIVAKGSLSMTPLYCHLGQIVSDTTERNDEIPSSKVVKETETTDPQVFCSEDTLKGHAISRDTTE